jgi:serine/threonine protein phosphatase PrpC
VVPPEGTERVAIARLNDEGRESWGKFELSTAGSTHVGRIRKANQDAFDRFDAPERGEILLVVADGMGGHRGGEVASRMAVGTLGKLCHEGEGDPRFRLEHAIERANFEIHKLASKDRTLQGMGTTIVALLLCQEGNSFVAHVGDSRLYRLRSGEFGPMTEDHSVVALLIRNGTITPEEARDHPKRNQIMRSLGVRAEIEIEIAEVDLRGGDAFLLCSDGLHGMLPDPDLKMLTERAPDPHTGVAWMIDAANQAGGMDNVTAMVAQIRTPTANAARTEEDE